MTKLSVNHIQCLNSHISQNNLLDTRQLLLNIIIFFLYFFLHAADVIMTPLLTPKTNILIISYP